MSEAHFVDASVELELIYLVFSMLWAMYAALTELVQLFSVQIVATSPVAELLSRLNYILGGGKWQKKDPSLLTRMIFETSLLNNSSFHWSWYVPSCIGGAFNRWCHISWICIECVIVVFPFLSIHLFPAVGCYVIGRTCNSQWIHVLRI